MKRFVATWSLSVCLAASAQTALPHFSMIDLGDLPGGDNFSSASAINDLGQVVGLSKNADGTRAFIWDQGQGMRQLFSDSTPLVDGQQGYTVYLQDMSVGYVTLNNTGTYGGAFGPGFLYQPANPAIKIYSQTVKAINDSGQFITMNGYGSGPGYLYNADNSRTTLNGQLSYSNVALPMALNNAGQVVGIVNIGGARYDAVMWDQQGNPISLNTRSGAFSEESFAIGINSSGTVLGYRYTSTFDVDSFIWTQSGGLVSLGAPVNVDYKYAAKASAINDSGVVIGNFGTRGFYWTQDTGMVFLDQLVDGLTPYDVIEATGINDAGLIVGSIQRNGNIWHAFVLTPVPEPRSAALMLLGSALMVIQLRLRRSH